MSAVSIAGPILSPASENQLTCVAKENKVMGMGRQVFVLSNGKVFI